MLKRFRVGGFGVVKSLKTLEVYVGKRLQVHFLLSYSSISEALEAKH